MTDKEIIGSWDLKSFVIEKSDGSKKSWGENMTGLLIYTKERTMSVSINSKNQGTDFESQFKSILFYSGTYEGPSGDTITHKVTQASDPNRIGKEMIRKASLENNILTLVGSATSGSAVVQWSRR